VHIVLRREPDQDGSHGRRRRPAEAAPARAKPQTPHAASPGAHQAAPPGPPAPPGQAAAPGRHSPPLPGRHTGPMAAATGPPPAVPPAPGRHTAPGPRNISGTPTSKPDRTANAEEPVRTITPRQPVPIAADRVAWPTVFALCGAEPAAVAATLDVIAGSAGELADTDLRDLGRHLAAAAQRAAERGAALRVAVTAASPAELAVQVRRAAQLLRTGPAANAAAPSTIATAPGIAIGNGARGRAVLVFPGLASTPAEHGALLAASLDGLRALDRLGVRARTAVGYSSGEIAALVWAGCLPATEAARLVAARGHVLRGCAARPAAMARITADLELAQRLCAAHGLHLAACETATSHLVAGPGGGIRNLARRGAESGIAVDVLPVFAELHSRALAACTPPLRAVLSGIQVGPPRRRLISTITGEPVTARDDVSSLLAGQLSRPVLFAQAMAVAAAEADVLVVTGPDGDPASPLAPAQPGQRSLSALATAGTGIPAVQAGGAGWATARPDEASMVATLFAAGVITGLLPYLTANTVPATNTGANTAAKDTDQPKPVTWLVPAARDPEHAEREAHGRVS
jgi:acyl transferase domain-containing protein